MSVWRTEIKNQIAIKIYFPAEDMNEADYNGIQHH